MKWQEENNEQTRERDTGLWYTVNNKLLVRAFNGIKTKINGLMQCVYSGRKMQWIFY